MLAAADIVCVVTAHSSIDYARVADRAQLVIDFRNAVPAARRPGGDAVSEPVRVGMVGLGGWGKNLLRNFAGLPQSRPALGVRRRPRDTRRPYAAAYPGVRFTADYRASCWTTRELEAVVLATPVPTHFELARRALEAGKHVMVEKPMTWRAAEGRELREVVRGQRADIDGRPPAALPPGVSRSCAS